MSPDGKLLFVTSPGATHPDDNRAVTAFTIDSYGTLHLVKGSPFKAGQGPVGGTIGLMPSFQSLTVRPAS